MDRMAALLVAAMRRELKDKAMLQHCRLEHLSFESLNKLEPTLFNKVNMNKLVCDACELGKHTRLVYKSIGFRSLELFGLVHLDVWGSCPTNSVSGYRWFVTFIDCYPQMT